jgi:hypothetical protein
MLTVKQPITATTQHIDKQQRKINETKIKKNTDKTNELYLKTD